MNSLANTPFVRTPLTDFATIFGSSDVQKFGSAQCKLFELKYADCVDAYGIEKGAVKCRDVFEDFHECLYGEKQEWRYREMVKERAKKIKEGKLEKKYMKSPEPEVIFPIQY